MAKNVSHFCLHAILNRHIPQQVLTRLLFVVYFLIYAISLCCEDWNGRNENLRVLFSWFWLFSFCLRISSCFYLHKKQQQQWEKARKRIEEACCDQSCQGSTIHLLLLSVSVFALTQCCTSRRWGDRVSNKFTTMCTMHIKEECKKTIH